MADIDARRLAEDDAASRAEGVIQPVIQDAMQAAAASLAEYQGGNLPPDYTQRIEAALMSVWGEAARRSGRLVIGEFKDLYALETKQDEESLFDQIVREFIEVYGAEAITRIVETTREQIRAIIADGQKRGLGLDEISRAIMDSSPEISRLRAHVIARTETHSSAAFASHRVAQSARRTLVKEWVSVEDSRTRDFGEGDGVVDQYNHRVMNGKTAALDQPYMVPTKWGWDEPMMFPGDPKASPGNRIMCRCQEVYRRAE